LKKLQFALGLIAVPLLLSAPWTLILFAISRRTHWSGFALIAGFVTLVYWLELGKEKGVGDAAMSTFATTFVCAAIVGALAYARAH
jgi:heme/copper-type cytochrome/quinol oxidase subunit 4